MVCMSVSWEFQLTVGFINTELNLCDGGILSLIPSFGGRDCERLWPYRCGGSIGCLAGERGYFRSCSGIYDVNVIKPNEISIIPSINVFDERNLSHFR